MSKKIKSFNITNLPVRHPISETYRVTFSDQKRNTKVLQASKAAHRTLFDTKNHNNLKTPARDEGREVKSQGSYVYHHDTLPGASGDGNEKLQT